MTSMLSLILALMLTMGGGAAANIGPGTAVSPVNAGNCSGLNLDVNEKPRLGEISKIRLFEPMLIAQKARIISLFRIDFEKSLLVEHYYFRARHLDPIMGRFLQTDPMGYQDSLNLYQALNMNPVNFTDPFGLEVDLIYFDSVVYDGNITKSMRRNLALTTEGTINTGLSFSQWFAHMLKSTVTVGYADQPWTYTTINITDKGDFFQINQDTRSAGGKIVGIVTDPIKGVSDWAANNILSLDPNINPKYQEQFHENAVRQTPGAILTLTGITKGTQLVASKINSAIKSSPYFENTWVLMDDAFSNLKVEPTGKTPQILLNKAKGKAFEIEMENQLSFTHENLVNQITVETSGGVKNVVDLMGFLKETGQLRLYELKASETAPLTTNQKINFPLIEIEGTTVVGKGKEPFVGGYKIPPGKVIIIRKK